MKKTLFVTALLLLSVLPLWSQHASVVWHTQSNNSSESMPCGGGDIGMNVWVEGDELLFYVSRSGTLDEANTLLKQGRFRLRLSPNPFADAPNFRQELKLMDGYVEISAQGTTVQLWADVFKPMIHVEVESQRTITTELFYENWRYQERAIRKGEAQQNSYKWAPPTASFTAADSVRVEHNRLTFFHRNPSETVFDITVAQQGLQAVKEQLMNPLANLTFGGCLWGDELLYTGTKEGIYAGTDYRAWCFRSKQPQRKQHIRIAFHTEQVADGNEWTRGLNRVIANISPKDKANTRAWWNAYWQRSFIRSTNAESMPLARNYTLFRYMLGCNAYGSAPTKFNGGLFTFDPCKVDSAQSHTPDYRKWGGGTMTAQNQRLVYWPMLKSGDADMMTAQFDFYNRMLRNAELRSEVYWQHQGACFAEQIENFGLPNPAEYGFKRPEWFDKGVEYNAWLEYEWDTILEFCQMILDTKSYAGADITRYLPLIESSLTFFDEHYQYLATRRGRKALDGEGHLVLFPGSACETYKMTNNASSTIAALRSVLTAYGNKPDMLQRVPPIPLRVVEGKQVIAPAKSWERINNTETPQLYPVFPWRIYGVGKEGLEVARNTYLLDSDAVKFRSHIGWKQDNIWAACLGLTDEAKRLALLKLTDGPHRFPAFWGPGFDWTPDHNHGGSGMIGLQEMLLQTNGEQILLFPAWPKEWNVHYKLHAPGQTTVEVELKAGKIVMLNVTPERRRKDIINCIPY